MVVVVVVVVEVVVAATAGEGVVRGEGITTPAEKTYQVAWIWQRWA